jgi:murein DD-endopeptidase MepM/ murein hydrolase activator NlpD
MHVSVTTPQIVFILVLVGVIVAFSVAILSKEGKVSVLQQKETDLKKATASLESVADQLDQLLSTGNQLEQSIQVTRSSLYGNAGDYVDQGLPAGFGVLKSGNVNTQYASMERDIGQLSDSLRSANQILSQIKPILQLRKEVLTDLPIGWPLIAGRGFITQGFGPSINPFSGYYYMHKGVDIADAPGTPEVAVGNGVVTGVNYDPLGYGNNIWIQHKYGFRTHYAHLHTVAVHTGEKVKAGQIIGTEGSTGLVTGPHLHFEVYLGDELLNPMAFLHR